MVELLEGNVLLKPAQKRRILSHLKRSSRLSDLIGDSRVAVSLKRTGRTVEARALVSNRRGALECRVRDASWQNAVSHLIRNLHDKVHAQRIRAAA
jgi:ribosome-associated translation inhibitor RaiA